MASLLIIKMQAQQPSLQVRVAKRPMNHLIIAAATTATWISWRRCDG